jgi:hypothetical protein
MELQDVQELSNFFERRVSAYHVGVTGTVEFDQDFRTARIAAPRGPVPDRQLPGTDPLPAAGCLTREYLS